MSSAKGRLFSIGLNEIKQGMSFISHALISVTYRKTCSISRTKFQSLNVSCVLLQLSSLNPLKPGVKLRMKM